MTINITKKSTLQIENDTDGKVVLAGFIGSLTMKHGDDIRQGSYIIDGWVLGSPEIEGFFSNCLGKEIDWELISNDLTHSHFSGNGSTLWQSTHGGYLQVTILVGSIIEG